MPEFGVRETGSSTEFVFTFPFSIPDELNRLNPAGYYRLFLDGVAGWPTDLKEAFALARNEGRPINKEILGLLRKIVVRALETRFEHNADVFHQDGMTEVTVKVVDEQERLRKKLIRTGPQRDAHGHNQTVKRLRRRYRELMAIMKKIRSFIRARDESTEDSLLETELEKAFPFEWVLLITRGDALKNLLPIPGHESVALTLSDEWTPRQLVIGVMACEERGRSRNPHLKLGATTIYEKYVCAKPLKQPQ
jgi:hypothetical protein